MKGCTTEQYVKKLIKTIDESIKESNQRKQNEQDFIETMLTLKMRISGREKVVIIKKDQRVQTQEDTIYVTRKESGLIEALFVSYDEDLKSDVKRVEIPHDESAVLHQLLIELDDKDRKRKKREISMDIVEIIEQFTGDFSGIEFADVARLKKFYDEGSKIFDVICYKNRINARDMRYLYANNDVDIDDA